MKRINIYFTSDDYAGKFIPDRIIQDIKRYALPFFADMRDDLVIPINYVGSIDANGKFIKPKIYPKAEEEIFNYESASNEDAIMVSKEVILAQKSCVWVSSQDGNPAIFLIKKLNTMFGSGNEMTEVILHTKDKNGTETFSKIDEFNPYNINYRDIQVKTIKGTDNLIDYMRPNKRASEMYKHNIIDLSDPIDGSWDNVYYNRESDIAKEPPVYENGKLIIKNAKDGHSFGTFGTITIDTSDWTREYN